MQISFFRLFLGLSVLLTVLFSCRDEEPVSTNPAHRLAFSADTLFFDTLFAETPSVTGYFMVYNRNNKPLEISKIELLGGENSPFRINIPDADNPNDPINYNLYIRAKDSLFVFVALTAPNSSADTPEKVEDDLVFYVNGNQQKIKLLAYGQAAVRPEDAVEDYVFHAGKPYLITNDMNIAGNVTMEAGARLYLHNRANLLIGGNLTIEGTLERPVIIRGDRLDNMFSDLPYDFIPGQWGGIRLTGEGKTHIVNHAQIRNGRMGLQLQSEGTTLTVSNSWIHNFDSCGIAARNSIVKVENSLISNCGTGCVKLTGGRGEFVYTTIANYYNNYRPNQGAVQSRNTPSVWLANYARNAEGEIDYLPLEQADFTNCIIYGNYRTELLLDPHPELEATTLNYSFSHCLLKALQVEEDPHFQILIWNEDPLFANTRAMNSETDKIDTLDFRLKEESPARNQAERLIPNADRYRYDLNGIDRYTDEMPDLGAFEYINKEE